ncbi:hypothetical protein, partial [Kitasatospora sp. Root107]|uniref:hypothetical protein n=1 Tax=Kitasatospora sp. Root107 TaxID=1736424 RepID=UPI00070E1073
MTSFEKLARGAWAYTAAVAAELLAQDYPVGGVDSVDTSDEGPDRAEVEAFISLPIPWWPRTFTTRIDLRNISGLSLDAVPALDRLPADHRACALSLVSRSLTDHP